MPLTGIGFGEMLVIAMLVLIVFGPQRLPEITRSVGKALREFKRGMNEIQRELEVADRQEKWGNSASRSPAAAAAAAATVTEGSDDDDPEASDGSGASGESPASDEAGATTEAEEPEPVIAPPMFGSDLPEEIESQLAPPHTETAVKIPVAPSPDEPQAEDFDASDSASDTETAVVPSSEDDGPAKD